MNYITTRHRH